MVRPDPVRCWTTAPLTVTVQVTSRPTLMTVTLADPRRAGATRLPCPRQHDVELGLQQVAGVDVGDVDALVRRRYLIGHQSRAAGGRRFGGGAVVGNGMIRRERLVDVVVGVGDGRRAGSGIDGNGATTVCRRAVDDHQRDYQSDHREHRYRGDQPQPTRRLMAQLRRLVAAARTGGYCGPYRPVA